MKKSIFVLLFAFVSAFAFAQPNAYTLKRHYANTDVSIDTVTNTGTNYLGNLVLVSGARQTVTVVITVTKVSGTVAGTITLQGSYDGTNFFALNTPETQTALATKTAADASAIYHYRLQGNPLPYYRVSWTGAGTMVAKMSAVLLAH